MRSPVRAPYGLIPEFEEVGEEQEQSSSSGQVQESPTMEKPAEQSTSKVISNEFSKDYELLKQIKHELNLWAEAEYEKRKVLRADFDRFISITNELSETIVKLETRSVTISQLAAGLGNTNKGIQESLKNINKAVDTMKQSESRPMLSYADMVQLPGKLKDNKVAGNNVRKLQPQEHIVMLQPVKPVLNEVENSRIIKNVLRENIKNKDDIRVKKTVNVRGGGLMIFLNSEEDKKKIIENEALKTGNMKNLKIVEPQNRKPRLIIYDVPSDLSKEELAESIFNKNFAISELGKESFLNGCKPLYKVGPKNKEVVHWIIECEPEIRRILINRKRVFVDMTSCRLNDFISVQRCFKCQCFGHVSKYCKKESEVCGHCAEDHSTKDCPNTAKEAICSNCKKNKKPSNHKVHDPQCPSHQKSLQQLIEKTNYGIV
ncbi:uncharacterized protein LOC120356092 [Nilaparvata lugens]|uniref:uncharacterized protein LOC120356092 n=1 Tax=Nilaparvata lugens TaxID=108931 RepID=UPI00193DCEA2|nr:uncharacterized protein LOC120356092 [Nilaparvata lugens]